MRFILIFFVLFFGSKGYATWHLIKGLDPKILTILDAFKISYTEEEPHIEVAKNREMTVFLLKRSFVPHHIRITLSNNRFPTV